MKITAMVTLRIAEFPFATVAIGGASILGGSGNYLGTIAGAMVLTGLVPALNLFSGALLIVYAMVILMVVYIGSEPVAVLWTIVFKRNCNTGE